MTRLSDDLGFFDQTIAAARAPDLVFDDESLEHVLYGKGNKGPTHASLFGGSRKHVGSILDAYRKADIQAIIDAGAALISDGCALSVGTCLQLARIMRGIVPQIPNPIMQFDLLPIRPLIEKIWQIALERNSKGLQKAIGDSLYRWYEHHMRHEEARSILERLIEIHIEEKNRFDEAVDTNNLAFEYLLEGRFREAIPGFEAAAKLFGEIGAAAQGANSLANCWMCRFECGDLEDMSRVEAELLQLAKVLGKAGCWQARKPLVLLARIAEQQGKIQEAIVLVKRAIEACDGSGTRYPEMDGLDLHKLEQKAVHS
ncbi:MAG: hypothetical protein JXA73_04985 [Acidobacteria bacterium]|nr:hypothetical protein [Acidobacteriota bacterium]